MRTYKTNRETPNFVKIKTVGLPKYKTDPPAILTDAIAGPYRKMLFFIPKDKKPVHPGIIFYKEYIENKTTVKNMADKLAISRQLLSSISFGNAAITNPLAFRIAKITGVTPFYWTTLQAEYDIYNLEKSEY